VRLPELLAPAGSPEAARAAVQNGADAIYLGGKQFSARQFADNFSDEELREILDYCHVYGVKVYVTVNTLVHDRELESALEYLRTLYNAGVDAVIMQDLGLIRAASKLLPGLTIHGSTQMTVHNSAGVSFLEEIGVQRVVLAREMSLEDITRVRKTTKMELEVFVHGALCISYSGQCLLSSMIGGRSGNRGKCAQPCRLPYALCETDKNSSDETYTHILSPKDLNLIEHLPKLIQAGVAGLKIEGRMKRPEYVAVVVGAYRQALDRYAENPDDYSVLPETLKDLAQVFNREFTTGYLYGNLGREMMSLDRPNNRGILLGRVQKVDRTTGLVTLRIDVPLSVGDEIEFWVTSGGRKEAKVSRLLKGHIETDYAAPGEEVQIELNSTKGIHRGDRVFKTSDAQLMAKARQSYTSPVRKRKIPLELEVYLHPGEPLKLTGTDSLGNQVSVSSEVVAEEAVKRPLTQESLGQQLDRLGNTPFELSHLDFDIDARVIIPISEINKTRRKLIEGLEEKRIIKARPGKEVAAGPFRAAVNKMLEDCTSESTGTGFPTPILSVSVADSESAQAALTAGAGRIYLGGENLQRREITIKDVETIVALAQKSGSQVYYSLPRIWHENELEGIKRQVQSLLDKGLTGFSCANPGSLQLLNLLGAKEIHADYPLNIFNAQAACFFSDKGAKSYCLSPELNTQEIKQFGRMLKDAEYVVHGWPPLMVSRHCVLNSRTGSCGSDSPCQQACRKPYGLKDRMKLTFPLRTDRGCRMYIYNSKELCLIENLAELVGYGVMYLRIEAKIQDSRHVERVVTDYDKILKLIKAGVYTAEDGERARERLEASSPQGITKGHYFRGV